MEDFILKEIDKIGVLIRALLSRMGLQMRNNPTQEACKVSKVELLDKLNLDIDTLIDQSGFIGLLVGKYGFSNENLEDFAELLYDFTVAAEDPDTKNRFGAAACSIYKYLDAHKASPSLSRYYILQELNKQH